MTQIEVIEGEKHEREIFTLEEDVQIWEFLHRFAYDEAEQIAEKFTEPHPNQCRKLWRTFIRETDSRRSVPVLCTRYRKMTKNLHKMPFGTEMKLNLYYSLDIPVPEEFTREAWRFAKITLNKDSLVEEFEMKTDEEVRRDSEEEYQLMEGLVKKKMEKIEKEECEKLQEQRRQNWRKRKEKKQQEAGATIAEVTVDVLPFPPKKRLSTQMLQNEVTAPPSKRPRVFYSVEDDVKLWTHLLSKVNSDHELNPKSAKFWKEFLGANAEKIMERKLAYHYGKMTNNLHKMPFDMRMKTVLYYALHIPVESKFLELLKSKTDVTIDENGCIVEYNSFELPEEAERIPTTNQRTNEPVDSTFIENCLYYLSAYYINEMLYSFLLI
ncbi:Protein CBG26866 [Caenorhabditis briggsae]|uniref:Protein CBG26866 n=1 Tax=Caenorhabditis briggsae TaxID=6238 RepID=B6II66_CAEBR|nr:Protein CBG26866 [Caenorhabditis briggsae]CAR99596.1 Protein CBG26866 [Caenorhabditis briggsae]